MAGIFSRIFKTKQPQQTVPAVVMGATPYFTPFSGNAYESDVYRAAVDAIARHGARLKGSHIIKVGTGRQQGDDAINYLLQTRPNPYMSAYDMLYKLITHYFIYNNAFALIQRDDGGNLTGIFPLNVSSMEFVTDPTDTLYCQFYFRNGQNYILPYTDIIHLRRHFNDNDLLGNRNTAILPALQLAQTQSEGITAGIQAGASIRGLLKYNQVLAPDKLKEEKANFIADYLNINNNGGVAALDSKADYVPLESKPYTIDADQLAAVKSKIYEYLGISGDVVSGSYDEQIGTAFYESVIEPLALQLTQEFTANIFTPIEQLYGNVAIFEAGSMDYASYPTRIATLTAALPMGLFSVDEAREILNMPPIGGDEGAKRLQTLNVVQADKAAQYQGVGGKQE
jgi:HK97 family phage portal protein